MTPDILRDLGSVYGLGLVVALGFRMVYGFEGSVSQVRFIVLWPVYALKYGFLIFRDTFRRT